MSLDQDKESVIMEFKHAAEKPPSVSDVRRKFDLASKDIDEQFGVIPLERDTGKSYMAVVSKEVGERIEKEQHPDFIMNWSNPKMDTFRP